MKEKSFSKKLYHTSREIARGSFRRFTGGSPAFLSVWGGQPEREASLFKLKFLAARVRVYVRQLADGRVFAAVCGQPVFALLDGSYAQAAASALVALLLCPFAAPMLLHWQEVP